jgi:VCBS repeat-containing protein
MQAGLAGAPTISTNFSARKTPGCLPATVKAVPDSYSGTNGATLSVPKVSGLLSNDTDSAGFPLSVNQLNGHGGPNPLSGTSAMGAAVTLNRDGSFTYDPTGSPALQALAVGQTVSDSFTYQAIDQFGGAATGTVTIRVTGTVHHPPVLSGIESSTVQYAAGTPAVAVTSSLAAADPDSSTLVGGTVSITSGFASAEDSLIFTNQNGITSAIPMGPRPRRARARSASRSTTGMPPTT